MMYKLLSYLDTRCKKCKCILVDLLIKIKGL